MVSLLLIILVVPISHTQIIQQSHKPIISNLNSHIDIFAPHVCFISIDNHLGINFLPLKYPIVVREINYGKSGVNLNSKFLISIPDRSNPYKVPCLNFFKYTSNHKPWNCLVHFVVYPSKDFSKLFIYPSIFQYEISTYSKHFEFAEPSTVPRFYILIKEKPKKVYYNKGLPPFVIAFFRKIDTELGEFYGWIEYVVLRYWEESMSKPLLTTNIFLVAYTQTTPKTRPYHEITKTVRIEGCGSCDKQTGSNPGFQRILFQRNSIELELKGFVASSSITPNTHWDIADLTCSAKNDRIFNGIASQLSLCENQLSKVSSVAHASFHNVHDLMFHGLATLLQDSMTNYTYNCFGHYRNCRNGKTIVRDSTWEQHVGVHLFLKATHSKYSPYHILSIPEHVTNLRFISCGGDRGTRLFPFSELFTVYDNYIWGLVVLSGFAMNWIIARIPKSIMKTTTKTGRILTIKYLFNALKVLLEQSDPFSSDVANTLHLRYAIGGFLLVGIVLSNAYKSENVYNMITLRQPIPYKMFHELVDNNFTIYSRSSFIQFDSGSLLYGTKGAFPNLTAVTPHFLTFNKVSVHMLAVTSEVYEWEAASFLDNSNVTSWDQIVKNTKLHPLVGTLVSSMFYPHVDGKWLSKVDEIRKDVWEQETVYLQKILSECNRAAVVAPELIVNNFGKDLQRKNMRNVYVGKEQYSNVTIGLELIGWIQPIVLKKIKYIKESGLWEWWPKFIRNSKEFILENSYKSLEESKPNMSGNILQIFIMLLCGLALSFVLFIGENVDIIAKLVLKIIYVVSKYLKRYSVYCKKFLFESFRDSYT